LLENCVMLEMVLRLNDGGYQPTTDKGGGKKQ
jgi:hypothetical protein